VQEDMFKLGMPSWIDPAPSRPGEKGQGSFSADQWRTFYTINLLFTLVRLWGSLPQEDCRYKMLINFMHLITAVRLADMRVMTEACIRSFEYHMRVYLEELIDLYPHTRITTYQHMSLHFGNLLRWFGPAHSWRCFAFERLNYTIRKFPTNSRLVCVHPHYFMEQFLTSDFRYGEDHVHSFLHDAETKIFLSQSKPSTRIRRICRHLSRHF
ncbi:hypothetical protein BT96DRAFT_843851, partial [Gymnopus androsaceus JB14]